VTFYVAHGDITGRVCSFIFMLLLLALVVRRLTATCEADHRNRREDRQAPCADHLPD